MLRERQKVKSRCLPYLIQRSGEKVYEGSTLTFTAAPDQDYSVQEWRVNGKVLKEDGIKVTDSTLTIANVEKDYTVTVQFKKSGSDTTITAGEMENRQCSGRKG